MTNCQKEATINSCDFFKLQLLPLCLAFLSMQIFAKNRKNTAFKIKLQVFKIINGLNPNFVKNVFQSRYGVV